MKLYPEEWESAKRFQQTHADPRLSDEQVSEIRATGKRFVRWTQNHPWLHNSVNLVILAGLLIVDILVLTLGSRFLLGPSPATGTWVLALLTVSAIHGFISYSVIIFSMHEGAAHDRIILKTGWITRVLAVLANNLCRVCYADPVYYRSQHIHHHADFGTQNDAAFTNFVWPRRFLISLLPLAGALDFNDYRIHQDTKWSWSRVGSCLIGTAYAVGVAAFMIPDSGLLFAVLVFGLVGPWFAFLLDRLRETTEHNLMALDTENGARNLGIGFWGLLVGGGPWGQPCHLSHHLMPALPWYQQCRLHRRLKAMMSPEQRQHFCIAPITGFPKLLLHVLRVNIQYARQFVSGHRQNADAYQHSPSESQSTLTRREHDVTLGGG